MNQQEPIHYNRRGSYCPLSDHDFAESVAARIAKAMNAYRGRALNVGGYTPPYNEGYYPAGFLTLTFLAADLPERVVGIEFGQKNEDGQPLREEFDATTNLRDPYNPHAGSVYAINFDEAWRIVCLVAQYLEAQKVTLSYGC